MAPDFGCSGLRTRTAATEQAYASRAAALCGVDDILDCRVEVLRNGAVALLGREKKLAPATRRHYRSALIWVVRKRLETRPEDALLREALHWLQSPMPNGRTPDRRTSALKARYVSHDSYFRVLQCAHGDRRNPLQDQLSAMLIFGPILGIRPCEWPSLKIERSGAVSVACAKATNGRGIAPRRVIEGLAPAHFQPLRTIVLRLKILIAQYGSWSRLYDILRSRLRTIARKLGIRISFYTLRHVAAGRQKQSGASRIALAALMGHASDRTATRHYARNAKGWLPVSVRAAEHLLDQVRCSYRERPPGHDNAPAPSI